MFASLKPIEFGGDADLEFRQLKTFVTIVKCLNFTKAAEQLGYAQSSVTEHIQALEAELDTMLFERLGKQLKLTQDGELFYNYAEQLLKLSDEAKNQILHSQTPRGLITIATPESFCQYHLAPILKEFRKAYPLVEVQLSFGKYSDFNTKLRKNTADIAFFFDRPSSETDLVTENLFEEPMAVIAAPNHPFAAKDRFLPEDCTGQTLILTEPGCSYRQLFESMLTQAGVKPATIVNMGNNEVIKQFVIDGWGIGFLPYIVVAQEVTANKIVALPWGGAPFAIYAQIVYHKDKWFSPALRAFYDLAMERLALK